MRFSGATGQYAALALRSLVLLAVTTGRSDARPPPAIDAAVGTRVVAEYLDLDASRLAMTDGTISGARSRFLGLYAAADRDWSLALGHEYSALDIALAGARPQTNGDLHTLHLAGTWLYPAGGGSLELALAPALSVSSNALKNPGEINGDSLQLWGSAVWHRPYRGLEGVLGIVHDYRFGEARAYVTAGLAWRGERVSLWATYPDVVLDWHLGGGWSASLALHPDGNQWQVFDRPLEESSLFLREAWRGELRLDYRWHNGLSLGLTAGYLLDQRWRFDRQDGEGLRTDSDDSAFFGFRVGWYR
ncbi:MAG: hypothetical protein V2I24_09560 [Halieaceae bacterium]|jgi:hypothetical protein|nr:hypothetical protein [Halieaceae bacterium]